MADCSHTRRRVLQRRAVEVQLDEVRGCNGPVVRSTLVQCGTCSSFRKVLGWGYMSLLCSLSPPPPLSLDVFSHSHTHTHTHTELYFE